MCLRQLQQWQYFTCMIFDSSAVGVTLTCKIVQYLLTVAAMMMVII